MPEAFFRELVDAAAMPYRRSGRYAWHFAKGKLRGDPVFRFLLRSATLPARGRLLDLGCGQGVLMALLQAAVERSAAGEWPPDWPAPPDLELHGVELGRRRSDVARSALGAGAAITRGDIRDAPLPQAAAIVILDVLLYLDHDEQAKVLARCVAALEPDGVLVLREANAGGGAAFQVTRWAERLACWSRRQWRQPLCYRPASEWVALLGRLGLDAEATPMSEGTPFGNVLFVARRRNDAHANYPSVD
ncbi:methyltransferase type 11 [Skermanella stibiiresistens SB22]|uniref:Methyltransferase type 11 n=1 Tax=Skermanella stibiiresistens SB22 TaxID=1385369 RepID=W9H6Q7_9PROT|nr:class I SAM-dependent methyltransferase [Skermanella stibiiresistens]EWY41920.1 methyltransferase type 11 [Skermanella stibiiresistens SB22]